MKILLVLGSDGEVVSRIRIPGARGVRAFAVDVVRRVVYLIAYYDAVLLRAVLPEVIIDG